MNACPKESILTAYAEGKLPPTQASELERHLDSCRRCAQHLADLPCWEPLVRDVRRLAEARLRDEERVRRISDSATALHESETWRAVVPKEGN